MLIFILFKLATMFCRFSVYMATALFDFVYMATAVFDFVYMATAVLGVEYLATAMLRGVINKATRAVLWFIYMAVAVLGFSEKIRRRNSPSSPGLKVEGTMT